MQLSLNKHQTPEKGKIRTPLLDSIEKRVLHLTKVNGKAPQYLFVGKVLAGGIVTELKKKKGGHAQPIDGNILFGMTVHVMRNGKKDQIDIC